MTEVEVEALLERLRTEGGELSDAIRERLLETALERDGRSALIGLVNRPGLTNAARNAIVEALSETLEPEEAPAFARALQRRHPSVLLAGIPVLERTGTAAALFALRKPLLRGEAQVDDACAAAGERLAAQLPAERHVNGDGVPPADGDPLSVAYAAAAASPTTLARIRERGPDVLRAQLASGVRALFEEVTARTQHGSSNDFDTRLRDELHEVVLLTGAPDDGGQQERSLENLFRRRDLADVKPVLEQLPPAALEQYARRALSRAQRRGERVDRSVLALEVLATAPPELRDRLRPLVLDCVQEEHDELAAQAIEVLSTVADRLGHDDRQQVIRRFGSLPPERQQQLAPKLSGLAATAEEELDVESFLRWVDGADPDEREARLRALKVRWDSTVVTPEQATAFLATLARGVNRLPADEQPLWREEVVEGALSWMYRQGTQHVEQTRALLAWPGFADLVLDDLDLSLSLLRDVQARGLLLAIVREEASQAERLVKIADAEVNPDAAVSVIVAVLRERVREDLRAATLAFERAHPRGRRRLLHGALSAAAHTKRRIEALGQDTRDAAAAAATRHGGAVLEALRQAEAASEGNEAVQRHFDSIRRAVQSALAGTEPAAVPEGVVRWRQDAASRFPSALDVTMNGTVSLSFKAAAPASEVARILLELDQRVHSPRVVTAEERPHLRQDLLRCIDHVVEADLLHGEMARAMSGRAALGQLVWNRWAERIEDPAFELVQVLESRVEPASRQQALLQVDALVAGVEDGRLADVVDAIPSDRLTDAWAVVTAGLANRVRQVQTLEQEVKSRGVEMMERVAERLDAPLRSIEGLLVGYFRLRRLLAEAGWKPIEDTLGRELPFDRLDPNLHEIDGPGDADRFIVRSTGISVQGRPVRRAVVEPLEVEEGDSR